MHASLRGTRRPLSKSMSVVALLHDLLARLVRRRFVVAVAAVAVVYGAPAVNVVGAAAAAASCALCPFRSSSWSLPHGVFLMEEDVALSLCELACMKVVVVVAVLFQRAWVIPRSAERVSL